MPFDGMSERGLELAQTVGMIRPAQLFFEDPTPDETLINPFFLAMLGSITRHCATRGFDLLISFQRMEDGWHLRYQDSHRAAGLILLGYGDYTLYEKRLTELVEHGTHFVRWGAVSGDPIDATVGSDNFGAGQLAGEHLLRLGRQRIAFLGYADEHYPEFADRYRGLCSAMFARGVTPDQALQRDAITTEEAGYLAAQTLLAGGVPFDAIFAASDLIAIGAMRALAEAGRTIPGDVAVVGFDDIPSASIANPPLTTIMQDLKGAGELLVETLLCRIDGREPPPRTLPARLIVRRSCGA